MEILEANLQFGKNYVIRKIEQIKRIILHHSGVSVLQDIEIVHNYHKNTRGYAGIGYHFYVRKDGRIYKGRPIEWVGAHAYGSNTDSIGICAEGDYNNEIMPQAQKEALIWLVNYLKDKYKTIQKVQGHREVCQTSCPRNTLPIWRNSK